MNSRERVLRALNHQSIDRAPRDLWVSPDIAGEHGDDVAEINARYPSDILVVNEREIACKAAHSSLRKSGTFTDAWQCTWHLGADGSRVQAAPALAPESTQEPEGIEGTGTEGVEAEVTPPLQAYELPDALASKLLAADRFACVNPTCNSTNRFTLAWCDAGPFFRVHALRGPAASDELHSKAKTMHGLLESMHELYCHELKLWCQTHADAMAMADELVATSANHEASNLWRTVFKPLLRDYCNIVHDHDKFLFLYCTRPADELLEDLVEIGVDAVHLPLAGEPARIPGGVRQRVTFWGGTEPLPGHAKSAQRIISERVLKMRKAFDYGTGGVIAHCHWLPPVPVQNVAAFYENWMIPMPVGV